jgi:hypothetical protein
MGLSGQLAVKQLNKKTDSPTDVANFVDILENIGATVKFWPK